MIRLAAKSALAALTLIGMIALPTGAYAGADGFGGTQASDTGSLYLGRTLEPGGFSISWQGSSGTCTHAYPNNDYFREDINISTGFDFTSSSSSNCNRVVLYPGRFQEGAGAVNCYRSNGNVCSPGGTYRSISWHNN